MRLESEKVLSTIADPQAGADDAVDFSRLDRTLADRGAERYRSNSPFPHISLEAVLTEEAAKAAHDEICATDVPSEKANYSTYRKYRQSDPAQIGPAVSRVIAALNSERFLAFLERLTGIENLIADPTLEGGGIHRIGTGGFLKVHTDFNFHRVSGLHRRLNILIYLNPDWDRAWGGAIELWQRDMSKRGAAYEPTWNRAVIFSTTDESYHGHPDPLTSPEGVYRNSIALYYYTTEAPTDGHRFERSQMTNYQERPGERFAPAGRIVHFMHQVEIRHPRLRKVTGRLRKLLG